MDRGSAGTEAAAAADDGSVPDATSMEVTRCSRDQAQGTRGYHRGAGHPARSTDARLPAGSCPTDTTQVTNRQTC
jgi:hypothetical protein